LFGDDLGIDDIIWTGPQPLIKNKAERVGIKRTESLSKLDSIIKEAADKGRQVHFLPQYRPEGVLKIEALLGIKSSSVNDNCSKKLIESVVEQRNVKINEEIEQIENALAVSYIMHTYAIKSAKPGIVESEIAGMIEGISLSYGGGLAFPVIFSVHGETLHNHFHGNLMKEGDIAINDSGASSLMQYASDITRTIPVSGKFSDRQKDIYKIVYDANMNSIEAIKPGIKFKDIHSIAAKTIAAGLKDLNLLKGDIDELVKQGAHAMFFPHGLGHMMGLDVHDMENLGENYVGYDETVKRSDQFGTGYLRLARKLLPGYVLTVEPGIYFIPELIDLWKSEKKFADFINYDEAEKYKDFGGVRIEDDVLVTHEGHRVLGKPIPKTVEEVEELASS
ncbi:M24 family metallopeptidase, partial [candidate division KSB1 bacterium]